MNYFLTASLVRFVEIIAVVKTMPGVLSLLFKLRIFLLSLVNFSTLSLAIYTFHYAAHSH